MPLGFANYTAYGRGINGIMVDITALPGTPTADDFQFKVDDDDDPTGWAAAPARPRFLSGRMTAPTAPVASQSSAPPLGTPAFTATAWLRENTEKTS